MVPVQSEAFHLLAARHRARTRLQVRWWVRVDSQVEARSKEALHNASLAQVRRFCEVKFSYWKQQQTGSLYVAFPPKSRPKAPYSRSPIHTLTPHCLAMWRNVGSSCPKTLGHTQGGNRTCSPLIRRRSLHHCTQLLWADGRGAKTRFRGLLVTLNCP